MSNRWNFTLNLLVKVLTKMFNCTEPIENHKKKGILTNQLQWVRSRLLLDRFKNKKQIKVQIWKSYNR
jgi:hypothetical protein